VATARVYDLTLVTADERPINAKACEVMANRYPGLHSLLSSGSAEK
jgi:hypothetical protein